MIAWKYKSLEVKLVIPAAETVIIARGGTKAVAFSNSTVVEGAVLVTIAQEFLLWMYQLVVIFAA